MTYNPSILCSDSQAGDTLVGIFDLSLAPELLLYAYVPALLLAVVMGFYIAYQSRSKFKLQGRLFLLLTLLFSLYLINDTVQWLAIPAGIVHFSWQMVLLIKTFLLIVLYYFFYSFITNQDLSNTGKYLLFSLLIPTLLILPTSLNIESFNLGECQGNIGIFYSYVYLIEFIVLTLIVTTTLKRIKKTNGGERTQTLLTAIGLSLVVLFLFGTDIIGEYTGAFEVLLIAPAGMLVFLSLIAFLIVRYRAFDAKMLAVQALVVAIVSLVGSQLFFIKSSVNFTITSITLLFTLVAGYFLVRSVKREVRQREEIQQLAQELARANERLERLDKLKSEFVSIASHQLRSPLTTMIGYASMLRDGSYGKLPAKAQEAANRIEDSSRLMASSVEDYLNVSRIEAGHMKYNLTDFSLAEQALHVTDDIRPVALKQSIVLLYRTKLESQGMVNADKGKTEQILHNLINNAIKYTEKGTITVVLHDDLKNKKLFVDVIDTGIGMSPETLGSIFQKFERGSNANSTNIHGTGLGLYTAAKLAEAMGGNITAHSEGEGKGSRFTLTLPLLA